MNGRTVYEFVGDAPWYLTTGAIVFCAFRRRRPRTTVGGLSQPVG